MQRTINDPYFRVEVISAQPNPQQVVWAAMHQDYSENFVFDERDKWPSEKKSGSLIVKYLLKGGRGHFGPLEHPQIVLNCGGFPHSCMQQLRTHRNASFDVQSFRYTGEKIFNLGQKLSSMALSATEIFSEGPRNKTNWMEDVEKVFYLRPPGVYTDRKGKKYNYKPTHRDVHLEHCGWAAIRYYQDIEAGLSEEHARGLIPFDVRQDWVLSGNARAIMHLLDVRGKLDVQLEARTCIEMIFEQFKLWAPAIGQWYEENRWQKGRLAP